MTKRFPRIMGVYQIRNTFNNHVYIGASNNVHSRFLRHKLGLRTGKHHSVFLQRAWDKYGEEFFEFELLEKVTNKKYLRDKEQFYIDSYLQKGREILYNTSLVAEYCVRPRFYEDPLWLEKHSLEDLISFYKEGHGILECGNKFDISRESVRIYFKKIEIIRKSNNEFKKSAWQQKAAKNEVIKYYKEGHGILECAKKFNIAHPTLQMLFTKWGILRSMKEVAKLSSPLNNIDTQALLDYYLQGNSAVECQKKFGISSTCIIHFLRDKGIMRNYAQSMKIKYKRLKDLKNVSN